jgi:hypothetical protein
MWTCNEGGWVQPAKPAKPASISVNPPYVSVLGKVTRINAGFAGNAGNSPQPGALLRDFGCVPLEPRLSRALARDGGRSVQGTRCTPATRQGARSCAKTNFVLERGGLTHART